MATLSVFPNTGSKGIIQTLFFSNVGLSWATVPTITASSGTLNTGLEYNQSQCTYKFTPSGWGTVTFTDTTDGSITCTMTCTQALAVSPVICPTTATAATVPVVFTSMGAGWTSGTLPTITATGGSLSALVFINSNQVGATFTPPSTAQTVTFADVTDLISCTIDVVATNVYTYTLADMLAANIMYGRWSANYRFNSFSNLLFTFSSPYSSLIMGSGTVVNSNAYFASATGQINNPQIYPLSGLTSLVPVYSNVTEAQYNIQIYAPAGSGWNTAVTSTLAFTIYSTAASKPSLQHYVNTWGDGTSETLPAAPSPYNSNGTEAIIGNNSVTPPLASGAYKQYGFQDAAISSTFVPFPDSNGAIPPLLTNTPLGTPSMYCKARFRAKTPSIYIQQPATPNNLYFHTGSWNITLNTPHLETDGVSTPAPMNTAQNNRDYSSIITTFQQWVGVKNGLDSANDHEYSVYAAPDRIMLGAGGTFTKLPPKPRLTGIALGDSHCQGFICWEGCGDQAFAWPYILSQLIGNCDIFNAGLSGDQIGPAAARFPLLLAYMPPQANGVLIPTGTGATATPTISGGSVTAITVNTGGQNYPGTLVAIYAITSGASANDFIAYAPVVNGVVQNSVTISSGGSSMPATTQLIVGAPTGAPDFAIIFEGSNDRLVTSSSSCRTNYETILNTWLSMCPGPVMCVFPYFCGVPYVPPISGTTFNNYDIYFAAQAVIAATPAYASRIFFSDQNDFQQINCGTGTTYPGGGASAAPFGFFAGGHMSNLGYTALAGGRPDLAPGLLPDVRQMLGSIFGGSYD